jgi:predicted secreted protein
VGKRVLLVISIFLVLLVGFSISPCYADSEIVSVDASKTYNDVQIAPGDTLQIVLEMTTGTGYSWMLSSDAYLGALQYIGHVVEPPTMPGNPVKDTWTFKAINVGTAYISMEYSQPWPGGAKKARTYQLYVYVFNKRISSVSAFSGPSIGFLVGGLTIFMSILIIRRMRSQTIVRR